MTHESLQHRLAGVFARAIAGLTGQDPAAIAPQIRPAGDAKFGDYQCNAAMALARELKRKPRDIAAAIADAAAPQLADLAEPLEIAGPGFINIRLKDDFVARFLAEIPAPPAEAAGPIAGVAVRGTTSAAGSPSGTPAAVTAPGTTPSRPSAPGQAATVAGLDRVGLPTVDDPRRIVVEYSQPNIAKQMHVGHLRSTIIGDVFARVLAFQGHDVVRQNHIGDWGTQFGMLIRWYRDHPLPTPQTHADVLEAIEQDYKAANERFKADPQFATEARRAVGELQGGDAQARALWERICRVSLDAIEEIYARLGVLLRPEDVRGESFYNDRLQPLVDELRRTLPDRADERAADGSSAGEPSAAAAPAQSAGGSTSAHLGDPGIRAVTRIDQGAVCVFMHDANGEPLFKNPEGEILPLIIQKSDGAFLYATTDLAAIRYRLYEMPFAAGVGAQRVVYVTDARQKLHFDMWMACARAAGWITPAVQVDHVTFGTVLGTDRRPLKTREGGTVKLRELLDEAERRALRLLEERQPDEAERDEPTAAPSDLPAPQEIARRVGIAAVKYADLRNDRNTDYVFDWDRMLSFQGNTAPYMMYAYARIRSIYRKAAERIGSPDVYAPAVRLSLAAPQERALALRLARFGEVVEGLAADLLPHQLCGYLYELAADFMRFYESCPVLAAENDAVRLGRLRLCDLTARTLRLGLGLLGIEVLERM